MQRIKRTIDTRRSVVLMTALVPTIGHAALIDFASNMSEIVTVIVSTRSHEPEICRQPKLSALLHYATKLNNVIIAVHNDDNAPQNPPEGDQTEFWDYWKHVIKASAPEANTVIASEPYGQNVADSIGAEFIPFDCARDLYDVRGTDVRADYLHKWDLILPEYKRNLTTNVIMFGQESVGKTTLSKKLHKTYGEYVSKFIPEYARPYLEMCGIETTHDNMHTIFDGQNSIQELVQTINPKPLNFFDTDTLCTVGYYRHFSPMKDAERALKIYQRSRWGRNPNNIYFLLPDDIPFEPDALRYGGDKRETTMKYWYDLLMDEGVHFYEVPHGLSLTGRADFCTEIIDARIDSFNASLSFKRELPNE